MPVSRHHYVMGTVVSFLVSSPAADDRLESAIAAACDELDRLDAIFSTWQDGSPMSRLRRSEIKLEDAPPEIGQVLELCEEARAMSAGYFDPWAMPGGVDPTGLVKGWAIERARLVLEEASLPGGLVNGGGDIAVFGGPEGGGAWRVGIQHPWRRDAVACVVELHSGEALATSGRYQRGEHLIVPEAVKASADPDLVASASVTGPSLAFSDGLATALCLSGSGSLSIIEKLEGYEAYRILTDGREELTSGFPLVAAA